MASAEITDHQKEVLAWKIMGQALRFFDQELIFADLHPGGGQYDCLSLITREGEVVLMLNRAGSSASGKMGQVEDIWQSAIDKDIRTATMDILSELDIDMYDENEIDNSDQVLTCKRMVRWVQSQSQKMGKPICCWIDDSNFVGQATALLEQVKIPDSWVKQVPAYKGADWSAWLFALTIEDTVVAMVNMKTGEAINADGSPMEDWYKKSFPISAKKIQIPLRTSSPVNVPDEVVSEIFALFRKVGDFNGYKVFGKELATVAESVSEHWRKTGDLPRDIEQIKAALFFEWRRSHHSGYFPQGDDLRYIQLLAAEIDKHPK